MGRIEGLPCLDCRTEEDALRAKGSRHEHRQRPGRWPVVSRSLSKCKATGEHGTFSKAELDSLFDLATLGIGRLWLAEPRAGAARGVMLSAHSPLATSGVRQKWDPLHRYRSAWPRTMPTVAGCARCCSSMLRTLAAGLRLLSLSEQAYMKPRSKMAVTARATPTRKAPTCRRAHRPGSLADDSGLFVTALSGASERPLGTLRGRAG